MRKCYFLVFLMMSLSGQWSWAQGPRFIYIENEQNKPFYVRYQNRLLSSSAEGYLIIPQLLSDSINLIIGFPKNTRPASAFQLSMQGKDIGLIIREIDSMYWGLYDHRSRVLLPPQTQMPVYKSEALPTTDRFSAVLAQVSNTPELNEKWVTVQEDIDPAKLPRSLDPPSKPIIRLTAIRAAYVQSMESLLRDSPAATAASTWVGKPFDTLKVDTSTIRSIVNITTDSMATKSVSSDSVLSLSAMPHEKNQQPADSIITDIKVPVRDTVVQVRSTTRPIDSVVHVKVDHHQDAGIVPLDSGIRVTDVSILADQSQTIKTDSVIKPADTLFELALKDTLANSTGKASDSTVFFITTDSLKTDTLITQLIQSAPSRDSGIILSTDSSALIGDTLVNRQSQLALQTDTALLRAFNPDEVSIVRDTIVPSSVTLLVNALPNEPVVKQEPDTVSAQAVGTVV
ncbi:MAG: hypothetical protein ACKO5C_05435, partial [Ferruginibacter sp.]